MQSEKLVEKVFQHATYNNCLLTDCLERARHQEVEDELAFEREMLVIKGEFQDLDSFAT